MLFIGRKKLILLKRLTSTRIASTFWPFVTATGNLVIKSMLSSCMGCKGIRSEASSLYGRWCGVELH